MKNVPNKVIMKYIVCYMPTVSDMRLFWETRYLSISDSCELR